MHKILVVEDEPSVSEMVKCCLEEEGHMVITVATGKMGINWVKEGKPDLAIIDLGLPDINGIEVCKAIKENPATRTVPVIILTGDSSNKARIENRLFAQANLYLNKPIAVDDLKKAVAKLLDKAEKEKLLFRSSINFRKFT